MHNAPIIRCTKSLLSEYALEKNDWPDLLPAVMNTLNNRRNPTLNNMTPNEINGGQGINTEMAYDAHPRILSKVGFHSARNPETAARLMHEFSEKLQERRQKIFEIKSDKRAQRNRRLNRKVSLDS